jgi:flagellar hook-associated protein 3 FlgL
VVTEKYLKSLNNISTDMDYLNNQVVTGRKFMKVSENTPAAVKAFQIRRDMMRVEGYQDSLLHAQGMLNNAESSIMHIQTLVQDAKEKILYGMNGSQSVDEHRIIAKQIRNLQQEMLQRLNSNATDLYYFGGNSVAEEPFKLDDDGKLMYRYKDGADFNWIRLEDLHETPDPTAVPSDPKYDLYKDLLSAGLFVDIGMSIRSENVPPSPSAAPYVDRNSVFTYTLTGISITGVGTTTMSDGTKVSNNIYDLLGAIADSFEDNFVNGTGQIEPFHHDRVDELYGMLRKRETSVQFSITDVGTKKQYLNFIKDSLDSRDLDNTVRQQDVEGADPARTIIYYESQRVAYQAALQMGTKVIPMSIFDYMR